jgi:hypothetical protein
MNRVAVSALIGSLVLPLVSGAAVPAGAAQSPGACKPSPTVLKAIAAPVQGLSTQQVQNATAIINAAAKQHVPERGQTIAVMTAIEESSLGQPTAAQAAQQAAGSPKLFGRGPEPDSEAAPGDPTAAAEAFYKALTKVKGWPNLPPTLAAHAAQRNLDPEVYARFYPEAVRVVNALTSGTGAAGLANLAARAQAVADCTAATVQGQFSVNGGTPSVGPFAAAALDSRALDFAKNGGSGWFDRCQNFVAQLAGRPHSGYSTALDAWQTFLSAGVAHPVTGNDGVAPPVGAWLYYRGSNPAGHVVTYLGNGQIASTDVFARGRVGIGPASAITDGPWHLQYLGWAAPWGRE